MILSDVKKDEKIIIVNCDCGCDDEIHIRRYEDNDYYITIGASKFYTEQVGILGKIKQRLQHIWCAIRGKEYLLCDICLTEEHIDELIEKLKEVRK